MARKTSPARLVIALSIAAVLAIFLLYTSIAGGGTPSFAPSQLKVGGDTVALAGKVVGMPSGDPHASGLRFAVRDITGDSPKTVTVVYHGTVPDQFRTGREVVVDGRLQGDVFVAKTDSMVTKCPSKYQAAKPKSSA